MDQSLVPTATLKTLVALSPREVAPAQANMQAWCRGKILELSWELQEARRNHRQAKKMHWPRTGWRARANAIAQQMVRYRKIQMAVEAGYLVVPNFDIDIIAVRTSRETPECETDVHQATPEVLPAWQGRYVGARLQGYGEKRTWKRHDGTEGSTTDFIPMNFNEEVTFPVRLVKPVILDATSQALKLKLFDRIGVVKGGRKSDPIVIGQIINPKGGNRYGAYRNNPTVVSFFIAWWLDLDSL